MYSYGQLPVKQHRSEPHGTTYMQILSVNVQPAPMSLGFASQSQPRADGKSAFDPQLGIRGCGGPTVYILRHFIKGTGASVESAIRRGPRTNLRGH